MHACRVERVKETLFVYNVYSIIFTFYKVRVFYFHYEVFYWAVNKRYIKNCLLKVTIAVKVKRYHYNKLIMLFLGIS